MSLKLKTAPASEPVSLAEMRAMMGQESADDTTRDAVIALRIKAARIMSEEFTQKAIITQTWERYAERFECGFDLKMNLQSVVSVTYIDASGATQTLDADQYLVDTVHGRIVPAYGVTWPSVREQWNAVIIKHTAGYGPSGDDVPQNIREAIQFMVAHWENYQPSIESGRITTIPYAVEQLLRPEKDYRGAF
jgi:uncharacterized phiE125 gp8 family phage protein